MWKAKKARWNVVNVISKLVALALHSAACGNWLYLYHILTLVIVQVWKELNIGRRRRQEDVCFYKNQN